MLPGMVAVQNIGGRVQNRTGGKQGHRPTEYQAEGETEYYAAYYNPERDEECDLQETSHEGKILLRYENR